MTGNEYKRLRPGDKLTRYGKTYTVLTTDCKPPAQVAVQVSFKPTIGPRAVYTVYIGPHNMSEFKVVRQ